MKCKVQGCNGEINLAISYSIKKVCSCAKPMKLFPCNKCGRAHNRKGQSVSTGCGKALFINGGNLEKRIVAS